MGPSQRIGCRVGENGRESLKRGFLEGHRHIIVFMLEIQQTHPEIVIAKSQFWRGGFRKEILPDLTTHLPI
jgi:hypothetical protein